MIELLAPAGNLEKLKSAFHFGADAVYLSGKSYGLRAFADNFDADELKEAVKLSHKKGKKVYVTLNIFAHNKDFDGLEEYVVFLQNIGVDAVIISDAGVFSVVRRVAPKMPIHISTQANVTNKYSATFWAEQGAERIVLARELDLAQIKEIRDYLPSAVTLEAFVHGAMCISYSGRCLLSNYMAGRRSNHGECSQSCRWEYSVAERTRNGEYMPIEEDERGTYIFNSRDMNTISIIDKLYDAGIRSFKIEGRVKTVYYVANTVNAYRRAIDLFYADKSNFNPPRELIDECAKSSHRKFFTGFYLGEKDSQCLNTSKPISDHVFCAVVCDVREGGVIIEQRNRFKTGDVLEVLSTGESFNKKIEVGIMTDTSGNDVTDALNVQQKLFIKTDLKLFEGDILRKA